MLKALASDKVKTVIQDCGFVQSHCTGWKSLLVKWHFSEEQSGFLGYPLTCGILLPQWKKRYSGNVSLVIRQHCLLLPAQARSAKQCTHVRCIVRTQLATTDFLWWSVDISEIISHAANISHRRLWCSSSPQFLQCLLSGEWKPGNQWTNTRAHTLHEK